MMNIGIDIRVLGTGRTSGVEEYTEQLLAHMLSLDTGVRYTLFYAGRRPLAHRPWMDAPNVTVHESGLSNRLLFARTRLTGRPYLDRLVGRADVFFFPHFLAGATSPECRRVLTMHDLSFERFPELFSVGRRLWHRIQMRPRVQVRAADRIIAVSESTRQDLIGLYGISPDRVTTVHSGVDPELQGAPLYKGAPCGRYILMLGTVEPRKNIECVISAFERLGPGYDDVRLVIAGPRGWLWRGIVSRVSRSEKRDQIQFVSDVSRQERSRLLSSASMLAYPSLLEGFGFPPLEAMACGTPALVAANSSLLETCGHAALAVDPYSVSQVSAGLAALLDDGVLRERLITEGYRRVRQFSWDTTARRTLDAIFSTLDT